MTRAEAARAATESGLRSLADEPAAVRAELDRILSSGPFRSSRRSQEFLEFTVSRAVESQTDRLKERLIGSALFGRPADYDTGADSIVRVVANETRRRLQQFYQEEGRSSTIRIELPSGAYVPLVRHVEVASPEVPLAPPAVPVRRPEVRILWAAVAILALCCALLLIQNRSLRSLDVRKQSPPSVLPWSALMRGNREFHIVLADTSVGGVQNMMRSRLSLSDYLDRKYIPNEDKLPAEDLHFYRYMMSNQFTSASYAITAARIAQFAQSYGASATVSYARDLSLRTFQGGGNFVVIGTSRANPWAQLFEGQLNFVLQFEDASREPWFVNRAPKAGEPAVYTPPGGSPGGMSESYGHVAFIPALYRGGDILFVTGTNSQATEAAGEFVTNVDDLNAAFAKAGVKAGSGERPFELLLRVRHTGGAPVRAELIAQR